VHSVFLCDIKVFDCRFSVDIFPFFCGTRLISVTSTSFARERTIADTRGPGSLGLST